MHYRPEIDGLRAIAVVPVILFHAGFEYFKGGFIGVDIFFVISGFLITSIIISEIQSENFSLVNFYERRARRILPALFLVITASIVLSYFILQPHQIKDLFQSVFASSLFLSNFFFYLETDYFNPFTNNAPLLHTWTLSVEEQFYIFFPIFILLIFHYGKKTINYSLLIILCVSLVLAQIIVVKDPNLAFYGTHTRAWELMVGCLAALNRDYLIQSLIKLFPKTNKNLIFNILCSLAMMCLLGSICFFDKGVLHPSLITLIPVLATFTILILGDHSTWIQNILARKLFVQIGLLSYSLYMFHQPILSFAHFYFIDPKQQDSLWLKLILLFSIAITSWLSYRYFEKPLRYNKAVAPLFVLGSSVALIVLFSAIGLWGHKQNGFQSYFANKYLTSGGVLLVDADKEKTAINAFTDIAHKTNTPSFAKTASRRIVVIGDSMADDVYFSLSKYVIDTQNTNIDIRVFHVDDECMGEYISHLNEKKNAPCLLLFNTKQVIDLLNTSTEVLISAKWQENTYKDGFVLAQYIRQHYSDKVYLLGSIMFQDLTSLSMEFAKRGINARNSMSLMYTNIRADRVATSDKLRALVANDKSINWIEKSDFFCNHELHHCTLFNEEGLPLIWDSAHLTLRHFSAYADFLLQEID